MIPGKDASLCSRFLYDAEDISAPSSPYFDKTEFEELSIPSALEALKH